MLLCMGGDLTCTVTMGRVQGSGIEKMFDLLSRRMRPCGKEHERVVQSEVGWQRVVAAHLILLPEAVSQSLRLYSPEYRPSKLAFGSLSA